MYKGFCFNLSYMLRAQILCCLLFLGIFVHLEFSWGVRFQNQTDWGSERMVAYPAQVKPLAERGPELLDLVKHSYLGSVFPYLHLTDLIQSNNHPFERYLYEVVDAMLSHPGAKFSDRVALRNLFYYNEKVEWDATVFHQSKGRDFYRVLPLSDSGFRVLLDPELKKVPALLQLIKIKAILDMINWDLMLKGRGANRGDYRNLYPVVDLINRVSATLLVHDILKHMGSEILRADLNRASISESHRSLWIQSFFGRQGYIQDQFTMWFLLVGDVPKSQLVDWVETITYLRNENSKNLKDWKQSRLQFHQEVHDTILQTVDRSLAFEYATKARRVGDKVVLAALRSKVVRVSPLQCSKVFF